MQQSDRAGLIATASCKISRIYGVSLQAELYDQRLIPKSHNFIV